MSPARDAVLPDAAARRAIAEELGTTMLVEAAAGTGKTTSLVDRMVALVATGTARVENLSRRDLHDPARRRNCASGSRTSSRSAQQPRRTRGRRERLDAALRGLDLGFLGTIHAFCARLLRERPVEARVDPDFREMDEPEDNVARDRGLGAIHRAALRRERRRSSSRLVGLGVRVEDLEEAYDAICENSDVEPAIGPETAEPDFRPERRARRFPRSGRRARSGRGRAGGLDRLRTGDPPRPAPAGLLDLGRARLRAGSPGPETGKAKEKAPRAFKLAVEALQDEVVKPALVRWASTSIPIATPILVEARDAYRAWRRENGP